VDLSQDLPTAVTTIEQAGNLVVAACRADSSAAVPTCPGWDVAALTRHVGAVHGWCAENLSSPADKGAAFPSPPDVSGTELADWAAGQLATLLTTMAATDPDQRVWAFRPDVPARFWWRRQVHETTVHAFDATNAVGDPWAIPGDVAADGIDEMFDIFVPRRWGHTAPAWGEGRTVHLHRTDVDGEWVVTISGTPTIERTHRKGDVAVRGSGSDLLLWVLSRPNSASVLGDEALAAAWQENFAF
jgi:uncharacterized protein (TIGR03083 family)